MERRPHRDRVGRLIALRQLLLVRHGESRANVAAAEADAAGALRIAVPARDADVELSEVGVAQAEALGRRLGELTRDERPHALWVSPYRRARSTAQHALDVAGLTLPTTVDERLRDRELGILDTLTWRGVQQLHPEEAARRAFLGKYYHRPPGGESWADAALRLRSVLHDIEGAGAERVLVVSHDAIVLIIRAVLEGIEEAELLELSRTDPVKNASVTRLVREDGRWVAEPVNDVTHLAGDAPVTEHGGEHRGTRP
ncbi:histidine phosphatase family protein [uncultured Amnibacterium sp.]|uniref:histidine phosphatase family protein n=1 Tax=uncultured Amnibacterium sp. TaxID=1631851 RepID=UPI0035C9C50B